MTSWMCYKAVRMRLKVFLVLLFSCVLVEQAGATSSVGRFTEVSGDVKVTREGEKASTPAKATPIFLKDTIETKKGATTFRFRDGSTMVLRDHSKIVVMEFLLNPKQKKRKTTIDILFGKIKAVIIKSFDKKTSKTELKTPTATVGIRGTDVILDVTKTKTRVFCLKGLLEVLNPAFPGQVVKIMGGKFSDILRGKLPQLPVKIPQDMLNALQNQFNFSGELNQKVKDLKKSSPKPTGKKPFSQGKP